MLGSRGMLAKTELSTKLNIKIMLFLGNIEEKEWILVCLNYMYNLDQITQLSSYEFLKQIW